MEIVRRASVAFVLFALGKLLAYVLQVTLARLSGSLVYGTYVYAFSVVNVLSVFSTIGFNNSTLRFVPKYISEGKLSALTGFFKTAEVSTLLGGVSLGIVGFFIIFGTGTGMDLPIAFFYALLVPVMAYIQLNSQLARSMKATALSIIPNQITRPALTVIIFLIAYLMHRKNISLMLAMAVLLSTLVSAFELRYSLNKKRRPYQLKAASYRLKHWISVSVTMILGSGFQVLLRQSDLVIIGLLISQQTVGLYNASARVAELASFILLSVNQVFAPHISSAHAENDKQAFQHELSRAALLTFVPTLIIVVILYFGSNTILGIFGHDFTSAKGALHILLLGQIINAAAGPTGYVLNLSGNHRSGTKIYGVTAVINIIGCYLAAKFIGTVDSVAWVTTSSMVLWNLWMHIVVVKRLKVWPSILGVFPRRVGSWGRSQ